MFASSLAKTAGWQGLVASLGCAARPKLWLAGAALAGAVTLGANDAHDFSGSWRVENVIDLGGNTGLTLRLELYNHSTTDVLDGSITISDSLVPADAYGSFNCGIVRARERVDVTADVVVSRAEYEHWASGGHPHLTMEFANAVGELVSRTIELGPMRPEEE
jgi:hypothetical protein